MSKNITLNEKDEIKYADGGEKYLYKIFKRKKYTDPFDLHRYIKDWPSKYHLTVERISIIHSVQEILDKNSKVLELGAGTGAITWYLAENFKKIDAIEGSSVRSMILKERTKRYKNVDVLTADITKVDYPKNFYDIITLIGVLEYIPFYSEEPPEKSVNNFLKKIYNTLSEKGILIIAIENKLGAKYFSGCKEDHNNVLFSGIIDYPFKSPITYSRFELENILKNAGFSNIQFYHLLPDYKIPKVFIREDEEFYEINPSGIWRGNFVDYSGSRAYLFSDSLFIENTLKSRTFFQFSNSFLVLASKSTDINLKTKWIMRKYWNQFRTKKEYHHFVDVIKNEKEDKIYVRKTPLYSSDVKTKNNVIDFRLIDQEWIKGTSVYIKAMKSLFSNNSNEFYTINNRLLEELIKRFSTGSHDLEGYPLVSGEALDFTYWNLKEDKNGNWFFFDRKWVFKDNIPADFVLFRNLYHLWEEYEPFSKDTNKVDFILSNIRLLFPNYTISRLNHNMDMENLFQSTLIK